MMVKFWKWSKVQVCAEPSEVNQTIQGSTTSHLKLSPMPLGEFKLNLRERANGHLYEAI